MPLNLKKEYGTDGDKSIDGVWVTYGAEEDGCKLKVARLGNKNYRSFIEARLPNAAQAGFRKRGALKKASNDKSNEVLKEAVAQHILKDWKGIELEEGKPFQFSPENAVKAFEEYPEFLDDVLQLADDIELFREEQIQEDVGNSSTASDGT